MLKEVYDYLKRYPISCIAFLIYCILWASLFTPLAIIIGEWPIAPVIAMPYGVIMLLNCLFRKGDRVFYLVLSVIILFPISLSGCF